MTPHKKQGMIGDETDRKFKCTHCGKRCTNLFWFETPEGKKLATSCPKCKDNKFVVRLKGAK